MQLLQNANDESSPDQCARELLSCVPAIMQCLRTISQGRRHKALSIQQFRSLAIVKHRSGISLSALAEQLGLAVPSASRLVGGLVRRGYLERTPIPDNRRQLNLTLRPAGEAILADTIEYTRQQLAGRLATLPPDARATVIAAMQILTPLFDVGQTKACGGATASEAVA